MPVRRIQIGQMWRKTETGQTYLVTKLYTEALASYALLRKAGAESEPLLRVKVERIGDAQNLPGFTFAQEAEEF
ncbi:MAG TPA: hypothetical protein VHM88_16420 [Candidatus Acidoferrales bacterium]|jgi:hypothetical protein|nr:hypothetical protein [Candidatus Acidoferrales bacterium]